MSINIIQKNMNLKKKNTRSFNVNLLSDFLLKKIPQEESTIIQISDCENFYVVKGKTSSKDLLNVPTLIDEFYEKYSKFLPEKFTKNSIDLIEYDSDLDDFVELEIYLYNTINCSYPYYLLTNEKEVKESMIVTSEFPHGYSLNQGRIFYYYLKNIVYSIPTNYIFTSLKFEIKKRENLEFKVYNSFFSSNDEDETLQSAILDCFDFDTTELENKLKGVDLLQELINPLDDYEFLKEIKKDFIIL